MKTMYLRAIMLLTVLTGDAVLAATAPTLQYLKDCKIIKQRDMTAEETIALQQLQAAEARMEFLQQPLAEMQTKMKPHSEAMQQLSTKLEVQARRGELDDSLRDEQQQSAEELNSLVAIYQKDIERVTEFSAELEKKANHFSDLVIKDMEKDSFDQIRIQHPGQTNTSCDKGIFFNKSIHL